MYLRNRLCRSSPTQQSWIIRGVATTTRAPFHFDAANGDSFESHQHRQRRFKRSSLRPITLFAICIPVGYALSWVLKSQDSAGHTDGFVRYTLVKKEPVSSTCSIFTLRPSAPAATVEHDLDTSRTVTSVQFKQPQLQIARSYTLLPCGEEQDPRELSFFIRRECNGEVSGYLHRLPLGAELELRGLTAEYVLPEKVDKAVFLAGGTGIAPAMQVANALADKTDVHILWASRRREDCLGGSNDSGDAHEVQAGFAPWKKFFGFAPNRSTAAVETLELEKSPVVAQLDLLKDEANDSTLVNDKRLMVDYYVDEEGTFIKPDEISRLLQRAHPSESQGGKKLLFVAGPDGFVNHWAASKVWINGREVQGPVGGVLSQMDLTGWEVVKL